MMKTTAVIGMTLLGLVWLWLAWGVLSAGFTLYNLLMVAVSGVIIFVPLWRKYGKRKEGKGK